jgi:hypothetical protein
VDSGRGLKLSLWWRNKERSREIRCNCGEEGDTCGKKRRERREVVVGPPRRNGEHKLTVATVTREGVFPEKFHVISLDTEVCNGKHPVLFMTKFGNAGSNMFHSIRKHLAMPRLTSLHS